MQDLLLDKKEPPNRAALNNSKIYVLYVEQEVANIAILNFIILTF